MALQIGSLRGSSVHLKGLDLNLLVVLDALLTEKNVTRTGQRINLSQPAVSSALARLRDFFGDQLLIQVGQRMDLTPFAERMVEPVREILLKCESIIDKNPGFNPKTSTRTFRLNMSDYEAAVIMNRANCRIRELAPKVRVEISSIIAEPTTRDFLERGYLDLIVTPAEMTSPLHPSERLYSDPFVAVVWSGNPIVQEQMTRDAYLSMDHIVAYFGKTLGWNFDEVFFAQAGIQRNIRVVASTFAMLMSQLPGSFMIATTLESHARFHAQFYPLRIFPVPFSIPPLEIRLQWHRFQENDPGIQWLRNVLQETAHELGSLNGGATVQE
jgi:LysR family transcriptional regulator, nod-box dependent transcriptional activator